MSNRMRAVLAVLVVALAVVLLIALKDDGDGGSDTGGGTGTGNSLSRDSGVGGGNEGGDAARAVPTIVIENGAAVGGVRNLTYIKGDRIRFKVDSDVSDEVHVHGYDIARDVEAGGSVRFDFPATIEGIFEVELEERVRQIAELRVNP